MQNAGGILDDQSEHYGLEKTDGFWNCLTLADIDEDGDMDFVAGNLGWNSRLKASKAQPVSPYIGDIDDNGSDEHIMTYFNQGKNTLLFRVTS
ncbi:MAG: hypothetical protein ABIR06_07480 [Cyclobacteriaceae bacterium]